MFPCRMLPIADVPGGIHVVLPEAFALFAAILGVFLVLGTK